MNWKKRRILVTGGGGFIGSHLVEELAAMGADVRAMVRYNSRNDWGNLGFVEEGLMERAEVVCGDIRDSFFVRKAVRDVDVVFHLAALIGIPYSYAAPNDAVDTNVVGTLNVLQASLDEGVGRVVHTSTSEVYGTAVYTPIDEGHPLQGQSPYSASKIGADKLAESYHASFSLPVATIRPFNTFGPRQSARAIIPTIISQALSGAREIRLGSLKPVRDFTYVKDTVRGFVGIAESQKTVGRVTNIGSGKGVTIGELAKTICSLTGSKAKIVEEKGRMRPGASEVWKLVCDASDAKKLIGWKPRHSLEQGLRETIGFMAENREIYKPGIYNV